MPERNGIEQIVERVVSQALDSHIPKLREEIVQRVLRELPSSSEGAGGAGAAELLRAVGLIHAGSTQREILRSLLDSANHYCERVALFVIKAGTATGWQGRGFSDGDAIKDFSLDLAKGLCAQALQERIVAGGSASQVDPVFIERFGSPANEKVLVLPLILKDKVAALVYADAGREEGGKFESDAVELLVASTSAWLEVISLRKQAPKDAPSEPSAPVERAEPAPPAPVQTATSFSDPFAGHAPRHAMASPSVEEQASPTEAPAPAPSPEVSAPPVEEAPVVSAAAASPAPVVDATAGMSPEDGDVHRKAQRFAKLLVDEIKLYNQAKVMEGRRNKDLYDRLKEDIEKSRGTYKKRYGNTAAASGDYFISEVVRSLAEDDQSIMGGNFRR